MTIDEAIEHAEWAAENCEGECADEHRQLAEWLRQAKNAETVTKTDKGGEIEYVSEIEFVGQSVEYVGGYGGAESIESAARTCTQTDGTGDSRGFVSRLLDRGHMSPFEFAFADFRIECDRAIQQELTRHRMFSFNVESTRMCDYRKKPLRFVTKPAEGMTVPEEAVEMLEELCETCADVYDSMLAIGAPRDYARKALPLALASKMRMAGNLRAWMEMIPKRLARQAHPEIRAIAATVRERLGEAGIWPGEA
jgi:thymidylate synthase (FAD)